MTCLFDYDVMYGNLDLTALDEDELYQFAIKVVKHFLKGIYLLGFTSTTNGGVHREFDLDNYEVSELSLLSSLLLDGFSRTGRKRYQDQVDTFLFKVSLFNGKNQSVKFQIKNNIAKEMRETVRKVMNK